MKKLILLVLVLSFSVLSAQQKYYIYLKDKGISPAEILKKSSSAYKLAEQQLTPRSIERRKAVMGENYITFDDVPIPENYISAVESSGIKIQNKLKWFNAVTAYLTSQQLNEVSKLSFVKSLEPVANIEAPVIISGEESGVLNAGLKKTAYNLDYGSSLTQNALEQIPEVHDLGFNGKGVLVGILDSGFRWKTHPALQNADVKGEYDFINKDNVTANEGSEYSGQDSHGTAVFSIIGGFASGNLIGPAYGASYLLAKTEYVPSETHVEEDNYVAALEWMESQGVDITTSSLGYNIFDAPETSYTYADMNGNTTKVAQALNHAFDLGVSTFTAAGNEGGGSPSTGSWYYIISPADAFNVISVGSVTWQNIRSSFSSHGPTSDGRIKPEVVAMGSSVFHATTSGGFGSGSGTSYATPIAAGVGALLKSAFPHLTNMQIRQIFLACGDSANTPNNNVGYGLISALRAVTYPNMSQSGNTYSLHKISVDSKNSVPAGVTLYYSIDGGIVQQSEMQKDGNVKFTFTLPSIGMGSYVNFYFRYTDSQSNNVREPANGAYSFVPGSAFMPITAVDTEIEIPSDFVLRQNYPNPFNPETTIKFSIPGGVETRRDVSLRVYDVLGREISTLVNGLKSPGNYEVKFDASDLPSGVYFYRMQSDTFTDVKKMILIR